LSRRRWYYRKPTVVGPIQANDCQILTAIEAEAEFLVGNSAGDIQMDGARRDLFPSTMRRRHRPIGRYVQQRADRTSVFRSRTKRLPRTIDYRTWTQS